MATTLSPRELKLPLVQTAFHGGATAIGFALGHRFPLFAQLTAITVSCGRFLFAEVNGERVCTMLIPNFSTRHAALNALTGAVLAFGVTYATTPRDVPLEDADQMPHQPSYS